MNRFSIISLGCEKNLVDSEVIVSNFKKMGFELTFDEENCDFIIINTCGFIKDAIKEAEREIEKALEKKKDGKIKKIFVFGCMVERLKKNILKKYPLVDGFFGVGDFKKDIISNGEKFFVSDNKTIGFEDRYILTRNHTAYLRISDGCNNFCSYCTIPMIRGKYRSKKIEDILQEAKVLINKGVKEIVLIAQDTTCYGTDIYGKPSLYDLLKKLINIDIKWIRLMYLYPSKINENLLKLMAESEKIVHYIEMPIQHISDSVLRSMNRKYSSKLVKEKICMIRKYISDVVIRTTFIVGFPKETDRDFRELLKFVDEYEFNSLSVFKYSKEKDTKSYSLKNISSKIVDERYNSLIEVQSRVVDRLNKNIVGKNFKVLFDSDNIARSYMDAPNIDGYFYVDRKQKSGSFKDVKVIETNGYVRKAIVL